MTSNAQNRPWSVVQQGAPFACTSPPPNRSKVHAFGVTAGTITLVVRPVLTNGRLGYPEALMESEAGQVVVVPPDRTGRLVSIRATHDAEWVSLNVDEVQDVSTKMIESSLRSMFEEPVELRAWCDRVGASLSWSEVFTLLSDELDTRMDAAIAQSEAIAHERLIQLKALDDESMQESILSMSRGDVSGSVKKTVASSSHTVQAILEVIHALGVPDTLAAGARLLPQRGVKPVEHVARSLHMQYRSVRLEGQWWKDAAGPLFAERTDDGTPVALIPRRGGYIAKEHHDDGVRTINRVTSTAAAAYGDAATMFYRSLPSGPATFRDMIRIICFGNRRDLLFILAITVVTSVLVGLIPILTGIIVGTAIPNVEKAQLIFIGAMLVSIAVSRALIHVVAGIAFLRIETRSSYQVIAALVDRILQLPSSFFRGRSAGDLTQRVMAVEQVRSALTQSVLSVFISLLASLSNLGILFYYDARLGLSAIVVIVIELVIVGWLAIRMARVDYRLSVAKGDLDGFGMDLLLGIRQIRVQGSRKRAMSRLLARIGRVGAFNYRSGVLGVWLGVTVGTASTLALVLVFSEFTAGLRASSTTSDLGTGGFVAFITALAAFMGAVAGIAPAIHAIAGMVPQIQRIRPILSAVTEVGETGGDAITLRGGVAARGVKFGYDPQLPLVLDGIDIEARPGEFIAIVGGTGCGKSTLLNILLGLEKPKVGQVLYDGVPLDSLDPTIVRSQLGVVMQSNNALGGNIKSMILGIGSNGTLEDAWAAARQVGMADEIDKLPMGMLTMLSPNALSQSQMQRLIIARALINHPEILFLDEATSALDNGTQTAITNSIDGLGSTRIVIAHRLSTIRNADRIYVLDHGRVVQSGTFEELKATDGMFRTLMAGQVS